jgi:hypothetical protein
MNALKRLAASTLLGLTMAAGAVSTAAAQCYDVYEYIGTLEGRYATYDIYEYIGTICFV